MPHIAAFWAILQGAITAVLRVPTGQTTDSIKILSPTEAVLRFRGPEVRKAAEQLDDCILATVTELVVPSRRLLTSCMAINIDRAG